jgi:hypothetical protein
MASPRRDTRMRRRRTVRNRVLTAWMRRPAAAALGVTRRTIASQLRRPEALRGVLDAAVLARSVRRAQMVIPPHIEQSLRSLEPRGGELHHPRSAQRIG